MCDICKDFKNGKISGKSAIDKMHRRLADERGVEASKTHLFELTDIVLASELPIIENNEEINMAWHREMYGDGHE